MTAASLEMLTTKPPRPSRADAASAPSSALVSRNGPSRLVASARSRSSQSVSASSASGTGPEARGVVDEHVEAAERRRRSAARSDGCRPCAPTSPTMPCAPRPRPGDLRRRASRVRATKATRAPRRERVVDQRQAEAGGAAGDGDAQAGESVAGGRCRRCPSAEGACRQATSSSELEVKRCAMSAWLC